jgi:hypothetical protein
VQLVPAQPDNLLVAIGYIIRAHLDQVAVLGLATTAAITVPAALDQSIPLADQEQ